VFDALQDAELREGRAGHVCRSVARL